MNNISRCILLIYLSLYLFFIVIVGFPLPKIQFKKITEAKAKNIPKKRVSINRILFIVFGFIFIILLFWLPYGYYSTPEKVITASDAQPGSIIIKTISVNNRPIVFFKDRGTFYAGYNFSIKNAYGMVGYKNYRAGGLFIKDITYDNLKNYKSIPLKTWCYVNTGKNQILAFGLIPYQTGRTVFINNQIPALETIVLANSKYIFWYQTNIYFNMNNQNIPNIDLKFT